MRGNNNCPYCRQTIIPMGSNVRQTHATPETTTTSPPNQSNAQPEAHRRGGGTNAESRENNDGWWRAMSIWIEQQSHSLPPALASAWAAAGVAREGEWAYALAAASAARANEA